MSERDDLEAKCRMPGPEGAMWRLVKAWSPNAIPIWLEGEMRAGTAAKDATRAVTEVMAGAAFGFSINMSAPDAARRQIEQGFAASLRIKFDRYNGRVTPGGIFMPPNKLEH